VSDDAAEERVLCGGLRIGVGVEGVAGELGEVLDVLEANGAGSAHDGVADLQLFEVLAERMQFGLIAGRAPLVHCPVMAVITSGDA
jgi:hypothetical protein